MSDNPFDGINDDMNQHTHIHLGAAAPSDSLSAAPVGTRIFPPSGQSPEGGRGATQPAAPERSLSDAVAPSAPQSAAQDALEPQAVTQTATVPDGGVPPAPPSTTENWQRRVLRALLADCRDCRNTRYGVLTGPEVEAIEDLIAASLGWTRTRG